MAGLATSFWTTAGLDNLQAEHGIGSNDGSPPLDDGFHCGYSGRPERWMEEDEPVLDELSAGGSL